MTKVLLLLAMLYAHIMDDYRHQGILASMKQRSWWKENAPDEMYKRDYLMALYEHAFSWAVAVHIPVVAYWIIRGYATNWVTFLILFVTMWLVHASVDNEKANRHTINLVQDQAIHIIQIVVAWICYAFLYRGMV